MSTFETIIWHILGYAAMPAIIGIGFILVAGVSVAILSLLAQFRSKP